MSGKKKKADVVDQWLEDTDRDYFDKLGPKSDAERQRQRRAKFYEIGPLPDIADVARREACRFDFHRYILTYCRDLLDHEPPPEIVRGLIKPLERAILHGGLELPVFGRGCGKTTIIKCAIRWALSYGHRRFIIIVGATKEAAIDGIFSETIEALGADENEIFAADFPGLALPIAGIIANKRSVETQLVNGKSTKMRLSANRFRLPSAVDMDGKYLEPSHGAILVACSIRTALKGQLRKKDRPDLVIIDDPETEAQANSLSETDKAERFIDGDVMALFGKRREPCAVMAITPILEGDLCTRFMDRNRHGEWRLVKTPAAIGWGGKHDSLAALYKLAYAEDVAASDSARQISRAWYLSHREEFADVRPVDPNNFTPIEVDAVHHLLSEWVRLNGTFAAECQLDVTSESTGEALSPETVKANIHGMPRFMAPDNLTEAVAFVDVNVAKESGLRYGVAAFGPGRRAAIIDYGRYPEVGRRLYPLGADNVTREAALYEGVKRMVEYLIKAPYTKANGERLKVRAICFDGGYEQKTIVPALKHIGATMPLGGVHLYWSLGFSWNKYSENPKYTLVAKDHLHSSASKTTGEAFLAFHADYWRDVAQHAYKIKYPLSGSLSLFKTDQAAAGHELWANETCYEKIIRTYTDRGAYDGQPRRAWEWFNARPGQNHSMDVAYGLLALAHWEGIYTAVAPISTPSHAPESAAPETQAPKTSTPSPKPKTVKRPANHSLFKPNPFKNYRPMGGGKRW